MSAPMGSALPGQEGGAPPPAVAGRESRWNLFRGASRPPGPLRVAVVAGGLACGGAEKQISCAVLALQSLGADVRVYTLERGGMFADRLAAAGVEPVWIGRASWPAARLAELVRRLRPFAPDVIQAGHSFVNLYAGLAARRLRALGLGTLRSSLAHCEAANGFWTRWLMCAPAAILVNSETAREELLQTGWIDRGRVQLVPNAIDIADYAAPHAAAAPGRPLRAIAVGRLVKSKRFDLFLRGIARARQSGVDVRGSIVGDGPERDRLTRMGADLGLLPESAHFLGHRDDVAALLQGQDLLVVSSEDEGFPNVILEAMAAGVPVLSTPAGDAPRLLDQGECGVVFPFGGVEELAASIVALRAAPERRSALAAAGRRFVASRYGLPALAARLREVYADLAWRRADAESLAAIAAVSRG